MLREAELGFGISTCVVNSFDERDDEAFLLLLFPSLFSPELFEVDLGTEELETVGFFWSFMNHVAGSTTFDKLAFSISISFLRRHKELFNILC
jgi:hypothetical protein